MSGNKDLILFKMLRWQCLSLLEITLISIPQRTMPTTLESCSEGQRMLSTPTGFIFQLDITEELHQSLSLELISLDPKARSLLTKRILHGQSVRSLTLSLKSEQLSEEVMLKAHPLRLLRLRTISLDTVS